MADVIRLNESRVARAGAVTVTTRAETIEHDFRVDLVMGPAAAIAAAAAAGVRAITAGIAPATARFRASALRALERGAPWAAARYPAGRAPSSSSRLYNDSGELAAGIRAAAAGYGSAQVVAPADRLDPPGAAPGAFMDRLRSLVPALADPTQVPAVRDAIAATLGRLIRRVSR